MAESTTVTIDVGDDHEEVTVPDGVLGLFGAENQTEAEVVGDLLVVSCAQRLHSLVAHGQEEPTEELQALETAMLDRFEERFGASFAELTGHSH